MLPLSPINRLLEFSLRFIGLWPDYSYAMVHRIVWTISMFTTLTFQFCYVIENLGTGDLPGLMDCLSIAISNNLLFIKLIILWIKNRVFTDILKMMTYDWRECIIEKENVDTMTKKLRVSRRYSNFFVGSYSLGVTFFLSFGLFGKDKQLLLKMELPFDYSESPIYELVNFAQFLEEFIAASTSGMMNALLVTLILHVDGRVEVICKKFSEISKLTENHSHCRETFRSLIKCHQRVIKFVENIENIFSYIALMQFLSNTLVIGLLGFLIVTSLDSEQRSVILARTIPYYILVNLEAFVLCFAGEFIRSKKGNGGRICFEERVMAFKKSSLGGFDPPIGMAIEKAAYECNWYELDPNECKSLLFLMIRSQKRFKITAGKFMDLSLEGFARMLKASASYVSVLHASY